MSQSQEEFVLKFGIDNSKLERDLRESDRIAKQYANKQGAAMNIGGMNGSTPQGWGSATSMGRMAGGISGEQVGMFGKLAEHIGLIGLEAGGVIAPLKMMYDTMKEAWQLAKEGAILQVSSSFMLNLSKAARSVGEEMGEATGKIARFEAVIGRAQEGSKEALKALENLGVSPWGKTMEQAITEAAEAFRKIEDPAKKARLAVELFGRGGLQAVEVMEALAEKQKNAKFAIVQQKDLDTLASAFGHIRTIGVGLFEFFSDGFKKVTAGAIRTVSDWGSRHGLTRLDYDGIKSRQDVPIEKPEKTEEQLKKEAEEERKLAQAKKEYQRATEDVGTLLQQEMKHQQHIRELQYEIKGIAGETAEKYKLQKELLEEQKKVKDLQKEQDSKREETERKMLEYGRQYYNLTEQQYKAERAITEAKSDRSGWGVGDIRNASFRDAVGAVEKIRGRRLTPQEMAQARASFGDNFKNAGKIQDNEAAAKAMRLLGMQPETFSTNTTFDENGIGRGRLGGPATFTVDPTDKAFSLRKKMGALTAGEQDPMRAQLERLEDINKNMAELLQKAKGEGIKIIPINGK